jgi:GTP 3',8-cyclase
MPVTEIRPANRLVDRFGRAHTYLRISVTDRCNLRCTYCMPTEGIAWKPREELLSYEEILRVARVFAGMGIRKIRLTGGEPLARQNLEVLVEQLALLDGVDTVAMTTNGIFLPEKAAVLKAAGLTALNISLDTLRRERFIEIAKRDELDRVLAGIDAALATGFSPLKLNVVVMAGINDDEILDFVEFCKGKPINLRFIEYMPFKDNRWHPAGVLPYLEMKRQIEGRYELLPLAAEPGAVGKDFQLAGYPATVGFVTSMTDSFCGNCNRLRLTADGQIKSCLFYPAEVNIRDRLRAGIDDAGLENLIGQAVLQKPEAHPDMDTLLHVENRPMIEIGG